jgi:hypothetical protein
MPSAARVDRGGGQVGLGDLEGLRYAGISGAKGRDKRPGLDSLLKAVNAKEPAGWVEPL